MLLIIAYHYVVNSGLLDRMYENPLSASSVYLFLFGSWGKMAINCFVLITGYFMCTSKITLRKFAKIVLVREFYVVLFFLIFLMTGYTKFSLRELLKAVLPVRALTTEFTLCFFLFFLCIPFLNMLISNMSEKQHLRLLALCGFMYVTLGTIPTIRVSMNYVSWFIVLYFIASYIRLYPKKCFTNVKLWGWLTVVSLVVSVFNVLVCIWIGAKIDKQIYHFFLADSNKVLAVMTALSLFMFFKNLKLKQSKFINTVAASTFGVLFIHANSDAMRQWLWKDVLNNVGMYDTRWVYLHAICSVIGVYIVCTLIDYLRIRWIEKPFFKGWDKYIVKFISAFKKSENAVCKRLNIQQEE